MRGVVMKSSLDIMETPIYGLARGGSVFACSPEDPPRSDSRRWLRASADQPFRTSTAFVCQLARMLHAQQHACDLRCKIPNVRKALISLAKYVHHEHPLIEQAFQTDRRDLFIEHLGRIVNLSKDEQILIPGVMELLFGAYRTRPKGLFRLYPFVMERTPNEPKLIQINPAIGFGKPVIAGTGISTAVVAPGSMPGNP